MVDLLYSNNILVNVPGLAKVGKNCFLNITIKDDTKYKLNEFEIHIYLTNVSNNLLGKSKITIYNLNKNQKYNTSVPIKLSDNANCKKIKNVEMFLKNCVLINKKDLIYCNDLLKEATYEKNKQTLTVKKIKNYDFYNTGNNKNHFISELGITLQTLNVGLLKKYNITSERSGMVVTKKTNKIFNEGDLIIELEMNSVDNIIEFRRMLKTVKSEKKNSIIINFIRNNKKKLIAAHLK